MDFHLQGTMLAAIATGMHLCVLPLSCCWAWRQAQKACLTTIKLLIEAKAFIKKNPEKLIKHSGGRASRGVCAILLIAAWVLEGKKITLSPLLTLAVTGFILAEAAICLALSQSKWLAVSAILDYTVQEGWKIILLYFAIKGEIGHQSSMLAILGGYIALAFVHNLSHMMGMHALGLLQPETKPKPETIEEKKTEEKKTSAALARLVKLEDEVKSLKTQLNPQEETANDK